MRQWNAINWKDPNDLVSDHFTVKDAIYLKNWSRLATEADGLNNAVKFAICRTAAKMEEIRYVLGEKPIFVRSWFRPVAYNKEIGGATGSAHIEGLACDFWLDQNGDGEKTGKDCDASKEILKDWLVKLDIRLEDNGKGARWCHADLRIPGRGGRFFRP